MTLPPNDNWPDDTEGSQLTKVNSLYFVGKVLPTTGYNYVGCRFDNCKFEAGILNMQSCLVRSGEGV